MPAQNVEIVFVIDTSDSMQPYIDALKSNLERLILPLQQSGLNVRFGLVAHSVTGENIYTISFLKPCSSAFLKSFYEGQYDIDDFFTDDPRHFISVLDGLVTQGGEHTPMGLDFALDYPFGPLSSTRRVVAFFSDERIEDGEMAPGWEDKISKLVDKAMARKIMLFGYIPESPAALQLSEAERSEMTFWDCRDIHQIDFAKLLAGMGKSISVSSIQATGEPDYPKALFDQDKWYDAQADPDFHDK